MPFTTGKRAHPAGPLTSRLALGQAPLNHPHAQNTFTTLSQTVRKPAPCPPPLPGDHLYRMDYRDFVRKHRESGAAITIAALPCAEKEASAFGLMKIDEGGRVVEFAEKPKGEALQRMKVDTGILGVDPET